MPRARAGTLLALVLLAMAPVTGAQDGTDVERALRFLAAHQGADGGWGRLTPYVVEAAASAGVDVERWPTPEHSAWAALPGGACVVGPATLPSETKDCEYKLMLRRTHAAGVAGYDPRDVGGVDGVAAARAGFVGGQFGDPVYVNDDIWAILALRAAGVAPSDPMLQAAADAIAAAQRPDGGWSERVVGGATSVDMTGVALAALAAAGRDVTGNAPARAFVLARWQESGSFGNAQSTAWAAHALAAMRATTNASAVEWLGAQMDADGRIGSDLWSTTEALIVVAGARHPLPGYAPASIRRPPCHALEPATLSVGAPFTRLDIIWDDGDASGATRTAPAAGEHGFRYHATGAGITARGAGSLACLSARPVIPAFPAEARLLRPASLTLDLSAARDPDGDIVEWSIDWGDGNTTSTTTHAYAHPGTYGVSLRAKDDAGTWSLPASLRVVVDNRAPVLTLPARIAADRVAGISLAPQVIDLDGDAVALSWRFGSASGEGAPSFVPDALGEELLTIFARDPYGAVANASVVVEVLNTPPTLRLTEEGGEVVAEADDADGPAPTVRWLVDGAPREAPIRLEAGTFRVVATAEDADGATASATLTVQRAPDSPPTPPAAPEALAFDAQLFRDVLLVTFAIAPGNASARVAWRSDVGDGEAAATSPFERALPGATWASVILIAEHDGLETRAVSGLLTPPAAALPTPPSPSPLVIAPYVAPSAPAPESPAAQRPTPEQTLEPASVSLQGARREAPGASPAFALAALVALALSCPRRR